MIPRKVHSKGVRWFRWFAILTLFLLGSYTIAAWWIGGALVAPVPQSIGKPPAQLEVESVEFASASGSTLAGWFMDHPKAEATVILLHPIRANRRAMLGRAELLQRAGLSSLLIDFQGHGESPGEFITAGHHERLDVQAAVEFARTRNPTHRIGIVGWSLGGAATLLAMPLHIDALVLESVYPSLSAAVHNRVAIRLGPLHHVVAPTLLVQLGPRLGISAQDLRPIDRVAEVDCPILIAAGDEDMHTTLDETEAMFARAKPPKQLVIFPGASHVDLYEHNPALYEREVVAFLTSSLLDDDSDEAMSGSISPSEEID